MRSHDIRIAIFSKKVASYVYNVLYSDPNKTRVLLPPSGLITREAGELCIGEQYQSHICLALGYIVK